ncbi:MAG: ammonia-forming cytochrome c nitrite reductase subunit c552 [Candidatus Eisenbacteria bacterium]|nr:ammonia-forming cytochrome c nitrite reductase subunit c552 [Candidatus Eisenbacteria bacterium]
MSSKPNYVGIIAIVAVVTFGVTALLMNVLQRKTEAKQTHFELATLDEETVDPAIWGRNFPRQFDGYKRTVDTERTRYGGSEAFSKLEADPHLKRIFAGYAFSIEFNEERGHAYTLSDQDSTRRVTERPQPGSCLHCHASIIPAYRKAGNGDVMAGFEKVSAMKWSEARALVQHPVACIDCHDPATMALRVTRPGFLRGIAAFKASQGVANYDPNKSATRQEMRSYVCGQCHVEYYFRKPDKVVTYPWAKGLKVEQIEAYYDSIGYSDWKHAETGGPVLKAQHPEFELWSQGVHARSNVACADCHMPYTREGAIKVSDHHIRSPLLNIERACLTCHPFSADEMRNRAEQIQERNQKLLTRAEVALTQFYDRAVALRAAGADSMAFEKAGAYALARKAQWRVDFINAENSMGFHAPQEAARILGEAIDYARQAELAAMTMAPAHTAAR